MRAKLLVSAVAMGLALAIPGAPFAAGAIVYDPVNAAHNALTAARMLQSLTNQAQQLQAQAQMLTRSPLTQGGEIGQALESMRELSQKVNGVTTDVSNLERQFGQLYPGDLKGKNPLDLATQSLARLNAARATAEDLARTAADLSGRAAAQNRRASAALAASEGAAGQTAAIQSSTQLMGVLTEQIASLQTLVAAQARLASAQAASLAADQAAADEAHRRLWAHKANAPVAPGFSPFTCGPR